VDIEIENVTRRRRWGALLFVTLGLVMSFLAMRGPAGTGAAPGPLQGSDELGQASPLAASTEWLRVTTNLSGASGLLSLYPDVAVSSNGQYVAVVWQEEAGDDPDPLVEERGYIYIRCAREGTAWWGGKRAVPGSYERDAELRGQMPAVALRGNRMHVVWSGGYNDEDYDRIYYQVGTIGAGNLVTWDSASPQTVAQVSGTDLVIPDIGVDNGGQPHVVWQQEDKDVGRKRYIYYNTLSGSAWGTPEQVSLEADDQNQDPAVAVEGTTAHVTWVGGDSFTSGDPQGERPSPVRAGYVYYANSDDGWAAPVQISWSYSNWQPLHPSIAALDGQVGVVWETWKDALGDGQGQVGDEDRWTVDYGTKSEGWPRPGDSLGEDLFPHFDGGDPYVQSVRPCLIYASNPITPTEPIPHVVLARTIGGGLSDTMVTFWHMQDDGDWAWETLPLGGSTGGERGAARIVIGHYGDEDHVHFVYQAVVGTDDQGQNRWDVFYTSDGVYTGVYFPILFLNK